MSNCKYCHDKLEAWNEAEPYQGICNFCQFEIDDDDKILAKMEYNHDIGSPDKFLANKFKNYLNG